MEEIENIKIHHNRPLLKKKKKTFLVKIISPQCSVSTWHYLTALKMKPCPEEYFKWIFYIHLNENTSQSATCKWALSRLNATRQLPESNGLYSKRMCWNKSIRFCSEMGKKALCESTGSTTPFWLKMYTFECASSYS